MAVSRTGDEAETTAEEAPSPRVFRWTSATGQKLALTIPERIKRGKVARRLGLNDLIGAFDVIFTPQEVEALEDLDVSPQEWEDLKEKLFDAIAGVDPKI